MTGRKSKKTTPQTETGAYHALPEKLQDSLSAVAKRNGNKSRKQFTASLKRQRTARAEKEAHAIEMKLQSTERDLINISYLHQKYFSPRCWKTVQQALDEFEKLSSKKDKIESVKREGTDINQVPWPRMGRSSPPVV